MKRINNCQKLGLGIFTVTLFFCMHANAYATSVFDGVIAYNKGQYEKALAIWEPLAQQGDSQAQYNLAMLYSTGKGVTQDDIEAAKWYQKAASSSHEYPRYKDGRMLNKAKVKKASFQPAPTK
jgi:TPR repeat protein